MSEERIALRVRLDAITKMLDGADMLYYEQIEPDNEYAEAQRQWDEGYDLCIDALETIKDLLEHEE